MITTDDLKAIKTYLDNIPAVHKKNRANDMVWPFNWRSIQSIWRILFFDANRGPFKSNPDKSAVWNRGAYLVEGLGHCAMCHTPSHTLLNQNLSLGAPIRKYDLTGNVVQGYLAPNITQTNLGAITDQQMIDIFTKGVLLGGGNIQGPMLEAVHDSLSHLTTEDLIAISTYLRDMKSTLPNQPIPGTNSEGAIIYNNYCSGCHASGVGGAPRFGDAASWAPLAKSGMKKLYMVAINGVGDMPPKGTCYDCMNSDIEAAVNYMVATALKGPNQPVIVATTQAHLTMADGKRIYQANCSSCHDTGKNNAPKIGDKQAWKPIVDTGILLAFQNVAGGFQGHPKRGDCKQCSDAELLAAVKYIMQEGATNQNYILW
jgi:cytochrome c5